MTKISDIMSGIDPDINHTSFRQNENSCEMYNFDTFISKFASQNSDLAVLSFNVRSYFKNFDEFYFMLSQSKLKFDIIVLTETWCSSNDVQLCHVEGYRGYHCFRKDKCGGGVSIFITESLKSDSLDFNICNNNVECLGVTIKLPDSDTLNVVGIYRPPTGSKLDFITILEKVMNDYELNKTKFFFMGDFNIC